MKAKVFNIIILITNLIFPFTLFTNCYMHKYVIYDEIENSGKVIRDYYNIIGISKSFSPYFLITSIILILAMLTTSGFALYSIIKKTNYGLGIRISSSVVAVAIISLAYFFGFYLILMTLILVTINMFLIALNKRIEKNKRSNMIIFITTYILFLIVLVLSYGFIPMA